MLDMLQDSFVQGYIYLALCGIAAFCLRCRIKKSGIAMNWKLYLFPVGVAPLLCVILQEGLGIFLLIKSLLSLAYGAICYVCLLPVRSLTPRNRALLALFYAALAPAYAFLSFAIYFHFSFILEILGRVMVCNTHF